MESCDFVDSIKAEKASALARYRAFTNITKLFQLMEVFVAVALISWSSTRLPLVFKFSGEYVSAFSSYFMNQHVVFLIGNVIVIVCYMLSRYPDSGNESGDSGFQYNRRKGTSETPNAKATPSQVTEIQIPIFVNEKSVVKSESKLTGETEIKSFQRSKSDRLKRQTSVKPHRELRRSVTETRRSMTVPSGGEDPTVKSLQAVEKLSNEEFRVAIEAFISKQQRFLMEQSLVEDDN